MENLKNASLYNIVVQPYARNQFAPFSFPISSNTLPYQIDLKLLWTSGQRIYVLNGTANTEMTVDVDYVTNFKNLIMIEDSNDNLYFTSENVIYAHDLSNNNYRILHTADYEITNLIYDSYSERFYYSNHVNKTIARITLQGFEETKYYLNSAPDEIMIDSELAKLCWHSKDIGVFCQDLGQTEINTLLITKVVNAKVTNVVMDTNSHKIIFTKYTPLEATRYELHEINIANNDTKFIEKLSFPYIKDGIFSIPGKIIFQQVSLSLIIFDIESKSFFKSSMHQSIEHLSISTKLDPNRRKLLPPTEIDPISLTIGEQNGGYIIKWRASDSNLILNVIYKVTLDEQEYFTNETYIEYINIKPFQKLKVTLTPTTKLAYGKKITKILYTEEKKPSRPENPRIFWSTKDKDYFDFTLRWEKPLEENGILLNYTIQCFHVSNDTTACTDIHTNGSINEAKFSLLKSDYYFTIKASTSAGFGPESLPTYSIKTEVIPVPVLFLGSSQPKAIHMIDLDLNQTRTNLISSIPNKMNYDSQSNSVFYIDNYQNLAKLNLETEETKIMKQIDLPNPEMSLDFVARFLYITGSNKIYRYDIESSNSKLKLIHLTKFQIKQIQVAYDGQIYIVSKDNELHILRFKQSETFMEQILLQDPMCPRNNEISQITPTTAKEETSLIVMNTANQLFSLDTGSLTCTKLPENMNHKVNYLKANTNNIFYLDDNSNELFRKFNGSPEDDKIFTPININKIVSLEVKCDECQLVPVQCKILTFSTQEIQLKEIDPSSVVVKLPAALQPTDCKFNLPPTNYTILTRMVHGSMENSSAYYKYIDNLDDQDFTIPNLMGNTEYETCVLISNIYVSSFSNKIICKNFTTLVGIPNAPEIRDVTILSPHKARFNWTLSGLEHSGNVTVIATVQSTSLEHGQTFTHNMYFYHNNLFGDIDNLLANTEYTVYLEALNSRNITGLKSNVLVFKTFGEPYVLSEPDITATSISFNISTERTLISQQIIVQDDNSSVLLFFDATSNLIQGDRRLISFTADNLTELTCYHININSSYVTNPENTYTHPLFENCIETESSRPQTPSVPKIETDDSGRNYMTWTKQDSKVWYELQIKNLELDEDWKTARNTTENIFVTHTLDAGNYTFRVRAANENGKSEYSAESEVVDIEKIRSQAFVSKSNSLTVIAITISFTCIILIFIGGAIFAKKLRTFDKNTKKSNGIWDENPIYGKPLTDEDLKEIPQIKRDQISFLNFLGRGAFGEVYQGTMKNMHDLDKGIAIKMLRQDASEMDKADFLKEAKIMWHFKHDHIVNLEAICLDVDANFLILELMEEGDLLRYLRNNRPKGDVYKLSLLDQVEMSLDVAKGNYDSLVKNITKQKKTVFKEK